MFLESFLGIILGWHSIWQIWWMFLHICTITLDWMFSESQDSKNRSSRKFQISPHIIWNKARTFYWVLQYLNPLGHWLITFVFFFKIPVLQDLAHDRSAYIHNYTIYCLLIEIIWKLIVTAAKFFCNFLLFLVVCESS